jgi:HPt (histidine-containing phosphotransfer) domain-containing protein
MIYNIEMLREMSGGDDSFVAMMVQMFIDSSPEIMEGMKKAAADARWPELGGLAHKIKPTIDTMGIDALKELIREVEKEGKSSANTEQLPAKVDKVISTLNLVIERMKQDFNL